MNKFIKRSLRSSLTLLKESVYAEEYAGLTGFLQSLEPRLKVAAFAFFLLTVLFASSTKTLGLLYAGCFLLVLTSRVSLIFFLKRTISFIPLFALFISLPALFLTGEPLFGFSLFGRDLIVTRQGLAQAELFVLRVTVSVSWVILLGLTTRHATLLKALRFFKVPKIFVMILGMTYRYIFLFLAMMENAYLGMYSRVGERLRARKGREIVAWNLATFWQRSKELNERVYDAMLSRGFDGEPVTLDNARVRIVDIIFLAAGAAALYSVWKIRFLN